MLTLSLRPGATLPSGTTGGARRALERLASGGATRDELDALAATAVSPADANRWRWELAALERHGAVCITVASAGRVLATLTPTAAPFEPNPPRGRTDRPLRLSRFAHARTINDALIIQSPIGRARVHIVDDTIAAWLPSLARGVTASSLCADATGDHARALGDVISLFEIAGLLRTDGIDDPERQFEQWEFADLVFHRASRAPMLDASTGGTFRFAGAVPPLPAIASWGGGTRVALPAPTALPAVPFQTVIDARRSVRTHGAEPLHIEALSTLLHHVAAIREMGIDGADARQYEVSRRAYPSAGGAYPLDLYLIVHRCTGLDAGVYRYDAREDCLERFDADWKLAESVFASTTANAYTGDDWNVLVVFGARFPRLSWKYESIAYSLLLAEVGALMQTMYLVATAMDLAPCALGTSDTRLFQRLVGDAGANTVSVGEFLLGSRAASEPPVV